MTRSQKVALLRIIFGLVWAIDATFKWLPSFTANFTASIMMSADGQPWLISWWYDMWMQPLMSNIHFFAISVAVLESLIAIGLLLGVFRKYVYIGGAILAFLIWSLGEGFGGPYGADSTDIGSAVIYIFVFVALGLLDSVVPVAWTLKLPFKKRTPLA